MLTTAERVLASHHDAEDCAASALAEVVASPPPEGANPRAWLLTITRRRAVDLIRQREREQRRDVRAAMRTQTLVPDIAIEVASRAEATWAAGRARDVLKDPALAVLQGIAEGQTFREIAAELCISQRSAESHALEARKRLKVILKRAF
jgi:RNA polymerase sigma factor (sigma-70 family)